MSESLFAKNLAYFKQELRDLKTGHPIALGSLDFYEKTASATIASTGYRGIYVRITTINGEPTYPYAQVFAGRQSDGRLLTLYQEQSVEEDGTIIQYYINLATGTYDIKAICTSDFTLIAKQYEDSDWIGE